MKRSKYIVAWSVVCGMVAMGCNTIMDITPGTPMPNDSAGQGGHGGGSSAGGNGVGGSVGEGGGGTGGMDAGMPVERIELCTIDTDKPSDTCFAGGSVKFGSVAPGSETVRLVRIDNTGEVDASIEKITLQGFAPDFDSSFTLTAVRFDPDPASPGSFIRTVENLPTTLALTKALYVEVKLKAPSIKGPLPNGKVQITSSFQDGPGPLLEAPILGDISDCPSGTGDCDGTAQNACETDLLTTAEHCGACNAACNLPNGTAGCVNGSCTVDTCQPGFGNCDANAGNGCETTLATDTNHCGTCGTVCSLANASPSCVNGSCTVDTCLSGFGDCDKAANNGCELPLGADVNNCGACGNVCSFPHAGATCAGGGCDLGPCQTGYGNCDNSAGNGCELPISADINNCGACGKVCSFPHAGSTCAGGACGLGTCQTGYKNCDNVATNGCESVSATDANNCGACGSVCNYPNSIPTCTASACVLQCKPNFYDIDGALSNGCEYACTKTSTTDDPDDGFVDANCDGIDGDVTKAIFVATAGSDANAGTKQNPVATLTKAITLANTSNPKKQVYVSEGTYSGRITLANGVSMFGGYSQVNGWKRAASYKAIIESSTLLNGRMNAVEGYSLTTVTKLDALTIRTGSTNATGISNYAMYCTNCGGLSLRNSTLEAGNAGYGLAGMPGTNGSPGTAGGSGGAGHCDNNTPGAGGSAGGSACSPGGSGGNGGLKNDPGQAGSQGTGGTAGGNGGGLAPLGGKPPSGGNGFPGTAGNNGNNGIGGGIGSVMGGFWFGANGTAGTDGISANGGGGGGGGAGQNWSLNRGAGDGGGGGGGGGCNGTAGTGGSAGGGSFGLFLVTSTGAIIEKNTIKGGNGGNGGSGGAGGTGGAGGGGGSGAITCSGEVGPGGNGGAGGKGGNGGHGGGGSGGPSYGIYRFNSTISSSGNILIPGTAGLGGSSQGNAGLPGIAATTN